MTNQHYKTPSWVRMDASLFGQSTKSDDSGVKSRVDYEDDDDDEDERASANRVST